MNTDLVQVIAEWLLEEGESSAVLVVPTWSSVPTAGNALWWLASVQRAAGAVRTHRRLEVGRRRLAVYALSEGYPTVAGYRWDRAWLCREADEVWELEIRARLFSSSSVCEIVDLRNREWVTPSAHTSGACLQCGGVPGSCGAVECR